MSFLRQLLLCALCVSVVNFPAADAATPGFLQFIVAGQTGYVQQVNLDTGNPAFGVDTNNLHTLRLVLAPAYYTAAAGDLYSTNISVAVSTSTNIVTTTNTVITVSDSGALTFNGSNYAESTNGLYSSLMRYTVECIFRIEQFDPVSCQRVWLETLYRRHKRHLDRSLQHFLTHLYDNKQSLRWRMAPFCLYCPAKYLSALVVCLRL